MKYQNKLIAILYSVLVLCSTGCSEDDHIPAIEEPTQELQVENESIAIKIGSENKTTLNIQQGGGEYSAFSLDENIAIVHLENGKVLIEGLINGKTAIVVSDKNGSYLKINVWSYTTDDNIVLSTKEISFQSLLGYPCTEKIDILSGNGFYTVSSDNENIKAVILKSGEIQVSAISKRDDQTATITVSDWYGSSEMISVTTSAVLEPYSTEDIAAIQADPSLRYTYNKVNLMNQIPIDQFDFINQIENGKQAYGWTDSSYGYNFIAKSN